MLPDGSNIDDAPSPKVDPHICNKSYLDVTDFDEDLSDLIATCQRHTRCSEAYCLRTRNGRQQCRFGYPKELCHRLPSLSVMTGNQRLTSLEMTPQSTVTTQFKSQVGVATLTCSTFYLNTELYNIVPSMSQRMSHGHNH